MGILRRLWKHRGWLLRLLDVLDQQIARGRSNRLIRRGLAARIAFGEVLTDAELDELRSAQARADQYVGRT